MKIAGKVWMVSTICVCLSMGGCGDDDDTSDVAFGYSCRDVSGQLCDNYYGEAGGGQADCVGNGGTYSTSKCSAGNSLGVCTSDFGLFGRVETVYYNNQPPGTSPQGECSLIGGTWSNTYNP